MLPDLVEKLDMTAYKVPADSPESDGTFEWKSTSLTLVEAHSSGKTGLGFTYGGGTAIAAIIKELLESVVLGSNVFDLPATWGKMIARVRNIGRPGIASMAIAAVDLALWDLKARVLNLPLARLLGAVRTEVPIYGSGGFTSYSLDQLRRQLGGWVEQGIPRVKMKVGREPAFDKGRVHAAREAIGPNAELFVDANGAYSRKQALFFAEEFAQERVNWFEEPVVASDLEGLRLMRDRAPAGMEIAAGEYGYDLGYFKNMISASAVDVLQADITRCAGLSDFMRVGGLCEAHEIPLSAHTSPSMHMHPCCALSQLRHLEFFHDHARIEAIFFDGAAVPVEGTLRPDFSRPGNGLELKRSEAAKYKML